MAEFKVVGVADFRQILEAFKQVEQEGRGVGTKLGAELAKAGDGAPAAASKVQGLGRALQQTGATGQQTSQQLQQASTAIARSGDGAVAAAGKTQQLAQAWRNVGGIVAREATAIREVAQIIATGLGNQLTAAGQRLLQLGQGFRNLGAGAAGIIGQLRNLAQGIAAAGANAPSVGQRIAQLGQAFRGIGGTITGALSSLRQAAQGIASSTLTAPQAGQRLQQLGQAFRSVAGVVAGAVGSLRQAAQGIASSSSTAPTAAQRLQQLGQAFRSVAGTVTGAVGSLRQAAQGITSSTSTAATAGQRLQALGQAFRTVASTVASAVGTLRQAAQGIAASSSTAPSAAQRLTQLGQAFRTLGAGAVGIVGQLRNVAQGVTAAGVTAPSVAQRMVQLGQAFKNAGQTALQSAQSFKNTAAPIDSLKGSLTAIQGVLGGVISGFNNFRNSLSEASTNRATQTIEGLRSRLTALRAEFEKTAIGSRRFLQLQKEIANGQDQLNKALGEGGGALQQFAQSLAAIGVGAAIIGFFKNAIQSAIELESITRKLANTLGPAGAAKELQLLAGLSSNLGLSFKTLAGQFASFSAAASAVGVPLQQQRELFAAVAKAGQSLGLSNDALSGSFLALQQIASKGTVSMEELRGQLGERLPIALAATAQGLGVSIQQLIKLVESGQLASDEFFPAFTKGLNQITQSSSTAFITTEQAFQKVSNAFDALKTAIGSNFLEPLKGVAIAAAGAFEFLANNAKTVTILLSGLAAGGAVIAIIAAKTTLVAAAMKAAAIATALFQVALNPTNAIIALGVAAAVAGSIGIAMEINARQTAKANAEAQKLYEKYGLVKTGIQGVSEAQVKYNTLIAAAPTRALQEQLSLTQQITKLIDARSAVEQSQFDIAKAAIAFRLQKAQEVGASEVTINRIKQEGIKVDEAAFNAKAQALQRNIQLQLQIQQLTQQIARDEANLEALQKKAALDIARLKLKAAEESQDQKRIQRASEELNLKQAEYDIATRKVGVLDTIGSIEREILLATSESSRNQLIAEAAAKGIALNLPSAANAAGNLAGATQQTAKYAGEVQRNQENVRRTIDATGQSQSGVTAKMQEAGQAAGRVDQATKPLAANIGNAARPADQISTSLGQAQAPAKQLDLAFVSIAGRAPAAVQGARDFATWLDQARNQADRIAKLDLGRSATTASNQAQGLARAMGSAADKARQFYDWLRKASSLPGSVARWSGGPVEAGRAYQVNELGQEAFMAANGIAKLIKAPAYGTWRAPSKGMVIPAGITQQMKDRGVFGLDGQGSLRHPSPAASGMTSPAGDQNRSRRSVKHLTTNNDLNRLMAEQALEIGRLRRSIDDLAQKDWSVNVKVRNDAGGASYVNTLNRMV